MAETQTGSQAKPRIPDIQWLEDNGKLIWALLTEMERKENCKVLLGKKDKNEVSQYVFNKLTGSQTRMPYG
jgi:hypothetical protein